MQKFSSNVVEKFLEKGKETVISKYIEEVSINNRIVDLMKVIKVMIGLVFMHIKIT